jgi:hypothetical protein
MKKIFCFAAIAILIPLGCGKSIYPGSTTITDILKSLLNPSKVVAASVFAIDSNNNNLGLVLGVSDQGLMIMTPYGYICELNWAGDSRPFYFPTLYFSAVGCTGTPYMAQQIMKGTYVYYFADQSVLLAPNSVNADGTATIVSASYQSTYMTSTCAGTSGGPISLIQLKQVTRADIGLPTTITPPIKIVSQ